MTNDLPGPIVNADSAPYWEDARNDKLLLQRCGDCGTLLALRGIDKWRLKAPVKHGDAVCPEQTVVEKKQTSKPERDVIVFRREIKNQRGEVVQATILYRCREGG
jgi:acyl dehydratase